jgi:hypothetical protein
MKCIAVSLQHQIKKKSVRRFMGHMKNSIYGLTQTRLYYGSIFWKSEMSDNFRWKSSILNVNKICETIMGHTGSPFMASHNPGYAMYQYSWKSELPNTILVEVSQVNIFNSTSEWFIGYMEKSVYGFCKLGLMMNQYHWKL